MNLQVTQARTSAVFLRPRANAELVHKNHVAMNASHAAFPTLSEFLYKATLLTKLSPDAQLLSSDAYSQHSNSHHLTFFTSRHSTLLAVCLYQKDERALPWEPSERQTLLISRFPVIISVMPLTAPLTVFTLSLSHTDEPHVSKD